MRHTQTDTETQAEEEAGFMQGARCGTPSQDSRIMPWAQGRRSTTEPPRDPHEATFLETVSLWAPFPLAALLNGGYVFSDTSLPLVHPTFIPVRTFWRPS